MNGSTGVVAAWWGYAEGNPEVVGLVVILVAVAAIAYLARRLLRNRRR